MFKGKKIIAVCIPRPYEATRFRYIELLNAAAVSRDFKLFVYQTNSDLFMNNMSDMGEEKVFDLIDYDVVDGIIVFTEMLKNQKICRKIADNAISRGIPVISVEAPMEGCINMKYDYGDCFEKIVRHIIVDHKLTKVNFIAGFEGNAFSEERHDVYKKVLAEQGIPYEKERVGYGNFWEYPTRQVMEKFLADGKELPEAIICCNDVMAMTACKCLAEKGYSVPDDVIVSGFDGIEDEKYHSPRLTTCRSSEENLARKAVDIIDRAINGEQVPNEAHISFEMVVSQSCGCQSKQTEDGSVMINELHTRLNGYMQRSYNMTSLSTIICNEKNIENIYEHLINKEELMDTYCCLNTDALQPRSGVMERDSECPFTDEMLMIFKGSYEKPITEVIRFNRKDIAPHLDNYIGWQVPLVFTSIHYLDTCLGYLCMAM
ncbi:MAG: substrate-binding domain-containing protein, partial [Oscillospiraceae bacterium]|nr:substrate-binding domain-containing protein [Oscillospiraceae bacterium]